MKIFLFSNALFFLMTMFTSALEAQDYVFNKEFSGFTQSPPLPAFYGTTAVACDAEGNIYVADIAGFRKLSPEGKQLLRIGEIQPHPGYMYMVNAVAVDAEGNIYAAESTDRIVKFNKEGKYVLTWGTTGSAAGAFNYIGGIAIDQQGNVFVSERDNHRIQKFDSDGNHLATLGSYGSASGQLSSPLQIAIDQDDNLYVAEIGNMRVQKFNSSGQSVLVFGNYGTDPGTFTNINSIAVDGNGFIYTGDIQPGRIQKFSSTGVFISQVGRLGSADGEFNMLFQIAADGNGHIFAVDPVLARLQSFSEQLVFEYKLGNAYSGRSDAFFENLVYVKVDRAGNVFSGDNGQRKIFKFNKEGKRVAEWGGLGSTNGAFGQLSGITLDPLGNVYTIDAGLGRVQKFDSDGNFILAWGSKGSGPSEIFEPSGIALDKAGNVFVIDFQLSRVQKFTANGTFLECWQISGTDDGQLNGPFAIAIDSADNVYISDHFNYRIQKFSSQGTFLRKWGTQGTGNSKFEGVFGIATDSLANVYVVDNVNSTFQKFDSTGAFLTGFGSIGVSNYSLWVPNGVAVDRHGNLYIANAYSARIMKYSPKPGIKVTQNNQAFPHNNTYHFGAAELLTSQDVSFTIGNERVNTFLTFTGVPSKVKITGPHAADFSVDETGLPGAVFGGTTATFSIRFEPSATGLRTATLHIPSNDVSISSYIIHLSGTATKIAQTISGLTDLVKTYGNNAFLLNGVSSSGLPLTYAIADPTVATLAASFVIIKKAGNTTITVSQGGNTLYDAADDLTIDLTIQKATLTVTAEDQSKNVGAVNPMLLYSYQGFVYSEDESVLGGTPEISSTALQTSPAGDYPIVLTIGTIVSTNYDLVLVDGTLTVNSVTSVSEKKENGMLHIFPNPSQGHFVIQTAEPEVQVTVTNVLGQQEVFYEKEISTTLKGLLQVEMKTPAGRQTEKLLVE